MWLYKILVNCIPEIIEHNRPTSLSLFLLLNNPQKIKEPVLELLLIKKTCALQQDLIFISQFILH